MGCGAVDSIVNTYNDFHKFEIAFESNPIVYFDLKVNEEEPFRIEMELFGKTVPKTVENFRQLCTGEFGNRFDGKPLTFKGSRFHRIVKKAIIQGGDITHPTMRGGDSIFGPRFPDENFKSKHDRPGILSMANTGIPGTNCSQFFIILKKMKQLDNKHVVFGVVTKGFEKLKAVEVCGSSKSSGKVIGTVSIFDCGQLE